MGEHKDRGVIRWVGGQRWGQPTASNVQSRRLRLWSPPASKQTHANACLLVALIDRLLYVFELGLESSVT